MHVRRLEPDRDWAEFVALNFRTWRDSVPADEAVVEADFARHHAWLLKHLAPQDPERAVVFVAEVSGQYAGHVWVGSQVEFFTRRTDPWIFDLSVKPGFRRRGIARALHQAALEWLRERGFERVGLQVMAHNEAARKLYESLGYRPRAISMSRAAGEPDYSSGKPQST